MGEKLAQEENAESEVKSIRCGCDCHTGNYHFKKKVTICTACGTIQEVNIEKMKKTKKGAKKKNGTRK